MIFETMEICSLNDARVNAKIHIGTSGSQSLNRISQ